MAKSDNGAVEWRSVKVPPATYARIKRLMSTAARDGWSRFGLDREDPPTISALVDAATALLEEHGAATKRTPLARRRDRT